MLMMASLILILCCLMLCDYNMVMVPMVLLMMIRCMMSMYVYSCFNYNCDTLGSGPRHAGEEMLWQSLFYCTFGRVLLECHVR